MDKERFDAITRGLTCGSSRRAALRSLAGGFAAVVGLSRLTADDAEASATIKGCRPPGQRCDKDKSCCTNHCRGNACACAPRGKTCLQVVSNQLPPLPNKALCCSSKCGKDGKCR